MASFSRRPCAERRHALPQPRFGRVPQDNPPFGQRRDEFDDAVVSPIGTTVQSVSTQKALAGFASLSYDGKAVEYDHPFAATAAGKPAIYKMLIAPVRVNCTANSNRAATGNRRDTSAGRERAGRDSGGTAEIDCGRNASQGLARDFGQETAAAGKQKSVDLDLDL